MKKGGVVNLVRSRFCFESLRLPQNGGVEEGKPPSENRAQPNTVFRFAVLGVPIVAVVGLVFADPAAVGPVSPADPAFVGLVFDALAPGGGEVHHSPLHHYRLPMTQEVIVAPIYCSLGEETLLLTAGYVSLACHKAHILWHLMWSRFDVSSDRAVSDWVYWRRIKE